MATNEQHMPLAGRLSARLVAANTATAGKPIDLGGNRMPPGVRDGIARITALEWKQQEKDGKKVPKGEWYFFGRAIAVFPEKLPSGRKVVNCSTFIEIPWCDTPANPQTQRKATTFEENYDKFRSLMEALTGRPCTATDYNGIMTYWAAVMKALTNQKAPSYVHFETWASTNNTPVPLGQQPRQNADDEGYVNQKWTGRAIWNHKPDPAAGVATPGTTVSNGVFVEPPQGHTDPRSVSDAAAREIVRDVATEATGGHVPDRNAEGDENDTVAEVAELVQIAQSDPTGDTEDGRAAQQRLEEMAQEAGWTAEQTGAASDWPEVGRMALTSPSDNDDDETADSPTVTVGSCWQFCKRDKAGAKLKDTKTGDELPPVEVEVTTVDDVAQTCTVKTVKGGKDVIDLRSKKPTVVKWEWLE